MYVQKINSSVEMDPKEAEIQRQRELIGQMRDTHAGGRKKDHSESLPEKENKTPEEETHLEKPFEDSDNASTLSMHGSSPETLPRNDIPDNNGSADSSDAAGSPLPTPHNPEAPKDSLNNFGNPDAANYSINVIEEEKVNTSEPASSATPIVIAEPGESREVEADDELSSNDGNSFDTVKHFPMGNQNTDANYGTTTRALETLQKSQEDLKRQAQEEEEARYNYNQKKVDSDSDSDAELFVPDPCRQCETVRKDPRMKTKVCTLL